MNMETNLKGIARTLYEKLIPGADILKISKEIDENFLYNNDNFKPLHPCSIELGPICCNHSPFRSYKLRNDDIVSFTLGIKDKNRKLYKTSYTKILDNKNDIHRYLLNNLMKALKSGLSIFGPNVSLMAPQRKISKILEVSGINSIENVCGYCLNNSNKIIPNISPLKSMYSFCSGTMVPGERYYINVFGTNLSKHTIAKNYTIPTIYKLLKTSNRKEQRTYNYNLSKVPVMSKKIESWAKKTFGITPFSARAVVDNFPKISEKSISNLYNHGIIIPILSKYIYSEESEIQSNCKVFHIGRTVEITNSGYKLIV